MGTLPQHTHNPQYLLVLCQAAVRPQPLAWSGAMLYVEDVRIAIVKMLQRPDRVLPFLVQTWPRCTEVTLSNPQLDEALVLRVWAVEDITEQRFEPAVIDTPRQGSGGVGVGRGWCERDRLIIFVEEGHWSSRC